MLVVFYYETNRFNQNRLWLIWWNFPNEHFFQPFLAETRLWMGIGAPNENIVQNHLNIALLNVF